MVEEKFRKLSITHDLTKIERNEVKKLAEEAKEKERTDSEGGYIYRVRENPGNLKIIKIRK